MLRNFKKHALATAAAGALVVGATSANAALLLDDWTLVLTGKDTVSALGPTVINGIAKIPFTGIFDYTIDGKLFGPGVAGDGIITPGERFIVNGLQKATDLLDKTGTTILSSLNGINGFELTFDFEVNGTFISVDTLTSTATFTHGGPQTTATGLLNVYVDNLTGEPPAEANRANFGSAASYTTGGGGEKIATFKILPVAGGSVTPLSLDGSDDASFTATFLAPGVWFDVGPDGIFGTADDVDLADLLNPPNAANPGPDPIPTIAITSSTLDLDPDNNGVIDSTFGAFAQCGTDFGAGVVIGPEASCGEENGDARIAIEVPEPSAMVAFGVGLLGLAGVTRRRRRKAA